MRRSIRSRALATLGLAFSLIGAAPTPAPAPTPRTAIVSCQVARFFSWPDRTVAPSGTSYPPARFGDAFGIIGTGSLTTNGRNLTETTIDVVQPFGSGKHYWIATECVT